MSETTSPDAGATPADGPTPDDATSDGPTTDEQREAGGGHETGQLGDKGQKALERERQARRDAETRAADSERRLHELEDAGKSEVERAIARLDRQSAELELQRTRNVELEQEIARRDLLELKRTIAAELGVPPEAAHRLQGSDSRSLRADAERYLTERGQEQRGDIGVGRGGTAGARPATDMNRLIREASGRRDV